MRSSRPLASSDNRRMRCRDCGTCEQEPTVFFHVSVSVCKLWGKNTIVRSPWQTQKGLNIHAIGHEEHDLK